MTGNANHNLRSASRETGPILPGQQRPERPARQEVGAPLEEHERFAAAWTPRLGRRERVPPPRRRTFDVVDMREREMRTGRWVSGLAVQLAGIVALLVAAIYVPPYYTCRQARDQGMFFSGTTVKTCVRDILSQRYERWEDFVHRQVSRAL